MPQPTSADLQDLLRALAIIRGHEETESPDLVYTEMVAIYTHYRVREVEHASALRVVADKLAARYPTAPSLLR